MILGIAIAGFLCHTSSILPAPARYRRPDWHSNRRREPRLRCPIAKANKLSTQIQVDTASCDVAIATPVRASGFEPSVWGDFFVDHEPQLQIPEELMRERAQSLKQKIRQMFGLCDDLVAKTNLVDAIQHLGIDHLFTEEIDTAMHDIYGSEHTGSNLHEVALRFRLLREHGFWVSPDVFKKFKGGDGRFNNDMAKDARGLLSLYNAAHFVVHGEPELEEGLSFSRHHLESISHGGCRDVQWPLAAQVKRALYLPLPRTYKRVEARHYILEYEKEESHDPVLLELAKLDFNLQQHVHVKELKVFSSWYKDLYAYIGLNYIRDRVVELYTWSCIYVPEEGFALTRLNFAKLLVLSTILDDTYDAHATINDCRKLNEAIQRWDESAVYVLPDYLRKFFNKLLSTFKEIENDVPTNEKYRVACTRKEFQKLSGSHLQGAEWFHENYTPCFKEQVALSMGTSGARFLFAAMSLGRGDAVTQESLEWVLGSPDVDIVVACAKMGRFINDIAAFKRGTNKADMPSSVECYINEHKVTSDIAFAKLESLVEHELKTINQVRFERRALLPMVQMAVKIIHTAFFFYNKRSDLFTFSKCLRETLENLYVKQIPL